MHTLQAGMRAEVFKICYGGFVTFFIFFSNFCTCESIIPNPSSDPGFLVTKICTIKYVGIFMLIAKFQLQLESLLRFSQSYNKSNKLTKQSFVDLLVSGCKKIAQRENFHYPWASSKRQREEGKPEYVSTLN